MSVSVRDGEFDVLIAAASRVAPWPSVGVRAVTTVCAEMGLRVGMIGGESLRARGVIAHQGTPGQGIGSGGLLIAEDAQRRIHRLSARAIVRVSRRPTFGDPFEGWFGGGVIPLSTALRLRDEAELPWGPTLVVLGSGNAALAFGSSLLERGPERGAIEVICVESTPHLWGLKRYAGWEVERRRFEMLGGKLIEATPISIEPLDRAVSQGYRLRLLDAQGTRLVEAMRVVAAGPFQADSGVREYPPGSGLFELEQTASSTRDREVHGWDLEEARGQWLAVRLSRHLMSMVSAEQRERLERIGKRSRLRLRKLERHRLEPFQPAYQGKWTSPGDMRRIRAFSGVPQVAHSARLVASVECIEDISCNLCERACPESAIQLNRASGLVLSEADCTACGACLPACPSQAIVLVHEPEDRSMGKVIVWAASEPRWKPGDFAALVNRRGQILAKARVLATPELQAPERAAERAGQWVELEVPTHLLWEARGVRRLTRAEGAQLPADVGESRAGTPVVEVTLEGEKRRVREGIPLSIALYEMGMARPGDALLCPDGACRLCQIEIDGTKQLACQERTRRGMSIRLLAPTTSGQSPLCPCAGIEVEQARERLATADLRSPVTTASACQVGEGTCHGLICTDLMRRLDPRQPHEWAQWIDWRFPWADWAMSPVGRG